MQRKARWVGVQVYSWASWIDGDGGVLLVFLTSMMMTIIMSLIGWDVVRFICKRNDEDCRQGWRLCADDGGEALCRLNRSDSSMCHWVLRGGLKRKGEQKGCRRVANHL